MAHYIALIHKERESGYGVSFLDVRGVTAVADTLEDALEQAAIALAFAFEDWDGARPAPRSLDNLRADDDFLDRSADAVIAAVTTSPDMARAA